MAQWLRRRPVTDVAREVDVKLETEMVDLIIVEVVPRKDQRRHKVGVSEPRAAAAARQKAEHVAHDVAENGRRVCGADEHRRAVRGEVKSGSVLGARVSAVLPLCPPVLNERQLQGLDCVAVGWRRPDDVFGTG